MRRSWAWKGAAVVAALAVLGAGCGDDDESDEATEDPNAAYCELAAELDEQEDFPSVEQLEELREAAPNAIRTEIDQVVAAFLEAAEAGDPAGAFEDPEIQDAFGPIEDFEADVCGLDDGEDEGEEQDPSVTVPDPEAAQVAVTATEYAFALDPAAPAAGRTTLTMTNAGEERHVMVLFRIEEGRSLEDVVESQGDDGVAEEWESATAAAGETAVITADLAAGNYGMICYLPDPDGTSHEKLGMVSEFTVA